MNAIHEENSMKIKAIYDNFGKTFDRYTVYFDNIQHYRGEIVYDCLCMSANPHHPQGFCQHSTGQLGRHNGAKIPFALLPRDCQLIVNEELRAYEKASL